MVYLKPAIDHGIKKELVEAEIVNKNQNCLKNKESDETYSFSKLRYLWSEKYDLKEVKKYWGFGVRYDWIDSSGKNLINLLEE